MWSSPTSNTNEEIKERFHRGGIRAAENLWKINNE
jgi:hypothetical protein